MKTTAHKTNLQAILPLRNLFLHETNFQIRYNACHERGWTDSYLLTIDDVEIGYGSIKGQEIADRDTIFEFYLAIETRVGYIFHVVVLYRREWLWKVF